MGYTISYTLLNIAVSSPLFRVAHKACVWGAEARYAGGGAVRRGPRTTESLRVSGAGHTARRQNRRGLLQQGSHRLLNLSYTFSYTLIFHIP